MLKLVLAAFVRYLLVLIVGFFAGHHVFTETESSALLSAETINQIVDFLVISIVPTLLTALWGIWARVKDKSKIWLARLSSETMTKEQLDDKAKTLSVTSTIKNAAAA